MPVAVEPVESRAGPAAWAGRSATIFLVTMTVAVIAFLPRLGGAGIFIGILIAFGVTEILARRFPQGVRLRWLFRPTLVGLGTAAVLFLASVTLLVNAAAMCIEGGKVVGFPYYFFVQCSISGWSLGSAEFFVAGLLVDLAIFYFFGTVLVSFVRPRKPVRAFIA